MHPGFMSAISPILFTCRKLFFKALYMTDATCCLIAMLGNTLSKTDEAVLAINGGVQLIAEN